MAKLKCDIFRESTNLVILSSLVMINNIFLFSSLHWLCSLMYGYKTRIHSLNRIQNLNHFLLQNCPPHFTKSFNMLTDCISSSTWMHNAILEISFCGMAFISSCGMVWNADDFLVSVEPSLWLSLSILKNLNKTKMWQLWFFYLIWFRWFFIIIHFKSGGWYHSCVVNYVWLVI